MGMLFELCSACGGTGTLKDVRTDTESVSRDRPCPGCKPLRVVPTGATARQLEAAVERAANYEAALRAVVEAATNGEPFAAIGVAVRAGRELLARRGRA